MLPRRQTSNPGYNYLSQDSKPVERKEKTKVKTKLKLMLLAFAAVTLNLHAADMRKLPAPLPELMNQEQLAKWNADREAASKTAAADQEVSSQFFTGKPYVAEAGGYVFKYRTYNPEMSRWTCADPSGFPNGANNNIYTSAPISIGDSNGLVTFSGLTAANLATISNTYNGIIYTTTALSLSEASLSSLAINISVNTYTATNYSYATPGGGALFALSASNLPSTYATTYQYIQTYVLSTPSNPGLPTPDGTITGASFYDDPGQSDLNASPSLTFTATTTFEAVTTSGSSTTTTPLATLTWGYTLSE
jgi:RHS repeat-associated protein